MFNNNGIGTYTEQRRLRACLGGPSRQHLSKHAGRVADFQDHPNRKPAVLTVTQPLTPGRPIPATPDRPQPTRRSTIPSCSPGESLNTVANSGELPRELIQPRNDASSAFTEFLDAGHEGAQHVAYWTDDFQRLYDNALSLGYPVTQEGRIGGEHGRLAYLDTEHDHGTAIEISDLSGPTGPFFSDIRDAAANWDGTDPIRRRR